MASNSDMAQLRTFASVDAAENWFTENDPEGVAFEYSLSEPERENLAE